MSVYRVTGRRMFRDHQPGELFEAVLKPVNESWAIQTGAIALVERSTPTIQPGFVLPAGWQRKRGG